MNINQIKYFLEIFKVGSFSKAASNLQITQPALSLQLQKLEEELEYKLVDRTKKPLVLTQEGELFFEKAQEIVKMVDQLKNLSIEIGETVNGYLKVGIIPTLAPYFVPFFIDKLNTKYPGLHLEIQELLTEEIIGSLKSGDIDAGVIATPVDAKNILLQPLFYEKFFLYISDKHPLFKFDEVDLLHLDTSEVWYLQEGNCFQNQVNSICKLAGKYYPARLLSYHSTSIESLRRIVESKKGITFIPELATIEIPADYEDFVKPIKDKSPFREISLALSRQHSKKRLIEAFIEVALENIPPRMQKKPEGMLMDTEINMK